MATPVLSLTYTDLATFPGAPSTLCWASTWTAFLSFLLQCPPCDKVKFTPARRLFFSCHGPPEELAFLSFRLMATVIDLASYLCHSELQEDRSGVLALLSPAQTVQNAVGINNRRLHDKRHSKDKGKKLWISSSLHILLQ